MNWLEAVTFLSKGNCLRESLLVLTTATNKWKGLKSGRGNFGWGTHQHDQDCENEFWQMSKKYDLH